MKKTYYLIIGFCVLFAAADVLLIIKNKVLKRENQDNRASYVQNELSSKASQEDLVKTILNYEKIDGKVFKNIKLSVRNPNEDLTQHKNDFKETSLSKLLDDKKIVFRFFQTSCSECVTEQLGCLGVLAKKVGNNKIVMLTDKLSDEMSFFLLSHKLNFNIYETSNQDTGIDFDKKNTPYLFIIDKARNIHSVIILSPQSKIYSNSFYDNLVDKI
jgi:hypothetical protein